MSPPCYHTLGKMHMGVLWSVWYHTCFTGHQQVTTLHNYNVLATSNSSREFNEIPRCAYLPALATVWVGAETDFLGGQRQHEFPSCGDTHAVGGSLGTAECPTAAAVGLILYTF